MKTIASMVRVSLLAAVAVGSLASRPLPAAELYWDTNAGTGGFGSASGTWGTNNFWNTSSTGGAGTFSTTITTADTGNFGTSANGLGTGTIAVNTVNAGSLVVGSLSGSISLTGGTITLASVSAITNNSASTLDLSTTTVLSGAATSLALNGSGRVNLRALNTYGGATTLSGGLVAVEQLANGGLNSGVGSSSSTAANLVFNGGILAYFGTATTSTNRNFTIQSGNATITSSASIDSPLTWSGSPSFDVADQSRSFTLTGANSAITTSNIFSGTLADNGAGALSFTKSGVTPWTLNGTNTYSGGTTVTNGTLTMGSANALGSTSGQLTVNAGTLNMSSFSLNVGNLTGTGGTIQGASGARTLTIGQGDSGGGDYQGVIANGTGGTTALTKLGTGVITLSGANTYTGATSVDAGTLRVNGSLASGSAVSVGLSGTLGGNGTIGGALTVNGAVAPGNSIDTLEVASDVTWNGSGSAPWFFELGAGNTADLLSITGGTSDFLRGTGVGGTDFVFDFAASTSTGTFDLVTWGGTTSFSAGNFSFTNLGGGNTGAFQITGGDTLQFVAVPEPATAALIGTGIAILGLHFVRRRKA